MNFMEKIWAYRIVPKSRNEKKNLSGIAPFRAKGKERKAPIQITFWHGWQNSFWVQIKDCNASIIVDSGVIEELAEEIKKIKKGDAK